MRTNISCYVLLTTFEDGWDLDEFNYEDLMFNYCEEVLYIPESKIEEFSYTKEGIELILVDLDAEDLSDDWYVNLNTVSQDMYTL
jgi:hypothetical protein